MSHGKLLSHKDTDLVTRAQLMAVPAPGPTGTWKPIPHYELVEMLDRVLAQNQIFIREEKFALRRDGSVLFGVLELAYSDTQDGTAALGLSPQTTSPCPSKSAPDFRCLSATTSCSEET